MHRLLRDRGYDSWEEPTALRAGYPELADALHLLAQDCVVLVFPGRVILDDARALLNLMEKERVTQVVVVHLPAANGRKRMTDPARKELLRRAKGVHMAIFDTDLLKHPLVDHVDVPPHRRITAEEAVELLPMVRPSAYNTISATDPVVVWHGWSVGDLVAVEVRHGDLPPQVEVERVV